MTDKILITGGTGMIGKAIKSIIPNAIYIGSDDFDLRNSMKVEEMFLRNRPRQVIHLAAKVGGVKGNSDYMADFFTENMLINTNVLKFAAKFKVTKVVSLLSTCVYPDAQYVKYPLTEDQLHIGEPHKSNFGYAYAKRMLDVQSRAYNQQYGTNFLCAIPNNIYGMHDNFDLENGHVLPALIRKFWEAKNDRTDVTLWGDGTPLREFTHAGDIARALLWMLWDVDSLDHPLNIGNTEEQSIAAVAEKIKTAFDYTGNIVWDTDKPSGQLRKPSSNAEFLKRNTGFRYTEFDDNLLKTCEWFKTNYPYVRGVNNS